MTKLTKRTVESLRPGTRPFYAWDSLLKGFGVKVLPSGQRRYIVKYRVGGGRSGRQRWYMVGTHGAMTCDEARDIACDVLSAASKGNDPQSERFKFRESPTMGQLWLKFEEEHLPRRKESTVRNYQQVWRDYIEPSLGEQKVLSVTRQDIERLHNGMASIPYQANRAQALLSKMFNLAERWDFRATGTNPCRHVEKYKERARTRYLSGEELVD